MGTYTQLPSNAFTELQMNSGIICSSFTPATGAYSDIIGSTTGGIKITAVPTYEDTGADVDNCPNNTMEAKKLTSWECKIGGTYLSTNASMLKALIGAAEESSGHISLNSVLTTADFQTLWFVGDYGAAGFLAVKLSNALNTSGLDLTTSKDKMGQIAFEYMGHYSMATPTVVPLDIYIEDAVTMHAVTYTLSHTTASVAPVQVADGADIMAKVAAVTDYTLPAEIAVTAGGSTLTVVDDYTWDADNGVLFVKGDAVDGAIVITITSTAT